MPGVPHDDDKDGCAKAIGTLVSKVVVFSLFFTLFLAIATYGGWVLLRFWEWFVTPATSLPPPRLFAAAAFVVFLRTCTTKLPSREKTAKEKELEHSSVVMAGNWLLFYTVLLGIGYVFHLADLHVGW